MKPLSIRNLLLIAPLLFPMQSAVAASFDCGKAHSPMEKLICSDAKLSKLDDDLAAAYKQAIVSSGAKSAITQWQREWLRSYPVASCKNAGCLASAMSTRIDLLRNIAPGTEQQSKWNGKYVRFYRGKEDKNSASLLLIVLSGNRVHISGSAIWQGPNAAIGQVNTGDIEAIGTVNNGKLTFDSDGCNGELRSNGDSIIVETESGCGGLNVSFVGTYQKK
ncbi:MAG: hypothetical protein WAV95_01780 [Azonexus sp.]